MAVGINGNRRLKVYLKTKGHCWYCGSEVSMDAGSSQFTVDHVEPTNRGGSDDIDNLVPSCRGCNASKGDRSYEAFRTRLAWSKVGCDPLSDNQLEYLVDKGVDPESIIPKREPFPGEIATYGPDGWEDGLSLEEEEMQDAMGHSVAEDKDLWQALVRDVRLAFRAIYAKYPGWDPWVEMQAAWEASSLYGPSGLSDERFFFCTPMHDGQVERFNTRAMPFGTYAGMPIAKVPLLYLFRLLGRIAFLHQLTTYMRSPLITTILKKDPEIHDEFTGSHGKTELPRYGSANFGSNAKYESWWLEETPHE